MPRRSKQHISQDFKPGLLGWARRRVFPLLSRATAFLGIAMLAGWIVGQIRTDEHHWSQYLYWLPPILMVGGAWVMLILSAVFAKLARRLGGLLLRPLLLLLAIGCTGYLLLGEWHIHRVLTGSSEKPNDAIRVLHWNQSGEREDPAALGTQVEELGADMVLLANAEWGETRQAVLEELASFAPDERERWVNYSHTINANPAHFWIEGDALIASRYPMIRTGMVSFGSRERQQLLSHSSSGRGWIMFAEFDLDAERTNDTPFVVWFVDLPSDPTAWKMDSMREARREIDAWDGSGWAMGRNVWEQRVFEGESFPIPDLVIGDFNTPRGSASIELIVSGYTDAFESTGFGRGRSIVIKDGSPLERAMFRIVDMHIDLALVSPKHRVGGYALIQSGGADHAIQVADIVPGLE
jgi:hypothetical protein